MKSIDEEAPPYSRPHLPRGTPLHDLLDAGQGRSKEGVRTRGVVQAQGAPFLSVLMRTQGRREATIQEALLALAAQTNQDFEILILAHEVAEEESGNLRDMIDSFDAQFSERVQMIAVKGGGRSRPLNIGIDLARGEYLAILDDDDIVFGHWVEIFQRCAAGAPGHIVRSVPSEQNVRPTTWPGGGDGYEITSRPRCPWPDRFDLLDHLFENRTPPCSYAIPRSAFFELGIRFDETLPVLEDWDVLLRAAMMTGVADSDEVTALWRKWDRGDSSTFVHSHSEWQKARKAVIAKLDGGPLLLPPGSVGRLQDLVAAQDRIRRFRKLVRWRLALPIRTARRLRRKFLSRSR